MFPSLHNQQPQHRATLIDLQVVKLAGLLGDSLEVVEVAGQVEVCDFLSEAGAS